MSALLGGILIIGSAVSLVVEHGWAAVAAMAVCYGLLLVSLR